jgi:hypothetical protein
LVIGVLWLLPMVAFLMAVQVRSWRGLFRWAPGANG